MNNNMLRAHFDASPLGIVHFEINPDGKYKSADYRFVEVNQAFEKISGLKDINISGKTVNQVFPGTNIADAGWLDLFEKIAHESGTAGFEHFMKNTGCWFKVYAYPTDEEHIAMVIADLCGSNLSRDPDHINELVTNQSQS